MYINLEVKYSNLELKKIDRRKERHLVEDIPSKRFFFSPIIKVTKKFGWSVKS